MQKIYFLNWKDFIKVFYFIFLILTVLFNNTDVSAQDVRTGNSVSLYRGRFQNADDSFRITDQPYQNWKISDITEKSAKVSVTFVLQPSPWGPPYKYDDYGEEAILLGTTANGTVPQMDDLNGWYARSFTLWGYSNNGQYVHTFGVDQEDRRQSGITPTKINPGTKYFVRGYKTRILNINNAGDWRSYTLSNKLPWFYTLDKVKNIDLVNPISNNLERIQFRVTTYGPQNVKDFDGFSGTFGMNASNFTVTSTENINPIIEKVEKVDDNVSLVTVLNRGGKGRVTLKMVNSDNCFNKIEGLPFSSDTYYVTRGIESIVLDAPQKNNYSRLNYLVTTNANLSGLTASNFRVSTSGSLKATVLSVSKISTYTWSVVVDVKSGTAGLIDLELNNTTGVSPTIGGLPFKAPTFVVARGFPVITSLSPASAMPGEQVTIKGRGFIKDENNIFFGGTKATEIVSRRADSTELVVKVPAGATFAPVSVQNISAKKDSSSGFIAYSPEIFNIKNDRDDSALSLISFAPKVDIALSSGYKPRSIKTVDFNNDGYPDLAITSAENMKLVIYTNNKTGGFTAAPLQLTLPAAGGSALTIADVDGDGKQDIITFALEGSNHSLLIYQNTTSGSAVTFNNTPQKIALGGAYNPSAVAVTDLDLDGKPDIIVALDGTSAATSKLYIYPNRLYWPGTLSAAFDSNDKIEISSGKIGIRGIITGDLDKDGKPEIIIGDYGTTSVPGTTVTIFKNSITTPGTITAANFALRTTLNTRNNPYGLALGDLNSDGYLDLVIEHDCLCSPTAFIRAFLNQGGNFVNGTHQDFQLENEGKGLLAIRDLNGDGKPEIVAPRFTIGGFSVFKNNISGSLNASSFTRFDYKSGTDAQSVAIADFNLDGKGDVAVANTSTPSISIFRYQAPPIVTSFLPLAEKAGQTVTITGKNFNTTTANNIVYFGAVKAVVQSGSSTSLTVTVPTGATFGPITVLDVISALTGVSSQSFSVINTDDQLFFSSRNDYTVASSLQQSMIASDLDIDGIPELITVSPSASGSKIIVNRNTTNTAPIRMNSFLANQQVSITGSKNIYGIASGDIDGDGKRDVIAADYDQNKIWILLNSSGTLVRQSITYPVGANPSSVTIADLDGDGRLDIITVNKTGNTISILRNISTGAGNVGFENQITLAVGTAPSWIAAADLDADGKPELISTNSGSANVSVFRNTTSGSSISFATAIAYAVGTTPSYITAGDIDGDNKPELVTANTGSNNVSVLKNNSISGTISFATAVNYSAGSAPVAVALGDLTADGKLEIGIVNSTPNLLSILKNKAVAGIIDATSFETASSYSTGANPASIVIADLNKNGKAEIAVANKGANSISVFQNLIPPIVTSINPIYGAPGTSVTITGKNFNAVAQNNIVYVGATKAVVSSAASNGTSLVITIPQGATYRTISVLDQTTGLSGYSSDAFTVTNAETDGSFPFSTNFNVATGSNLGSVAAADLDGDGHTDLVTVDTNTGNIYIESNTGATKITSSLFTLKNFNADAGASSLVTADIDGDGKLDLVLSNFSTSRIYVLLNTSTSGNITFGAAQSFSSGTNPGSVNVADIDGDGKADILTVGKNTNLAYVLRNMSLTGNAAFGAAVPFTVGANPSTVSVRDLNNDGKPEIVAVNAGTDSSPGHTISVLQNVAFPGIIGASSFNAQVTYNVGQKPVRVAIGDVDGDGLDEIAVTNSTDNTVSVLQNTSTTSTVSFATAVNYATGKTPGFATFGDVNGDSKLDLAIVNTLDNTVSILLNKAGTGSINSTSFSVKQDFATGKGPTTVAITDLNNDGITELAVANSTDGTISVLRYVPIPVVTSVIPIIQSAAATITISGRNFNTTAAKNIVFFGATRATVLSASATTLTVSAPAGATYMPVSVLDSESGLTGYSQKEKFVLTNPNMVDPVLKESSFNQPIDVATQNNPSTVAIGDLDGDGKSDLVVVNTQSNSITAYHNDAADGDINSASFPPAKSVTFAVGDFPKSVVIGDVDGDGKLDLVVSNYSDRSFSVLRNNTSASNISFEAAVSIKTPSGSNMIVLNDMNADGKPDVITANAGSSTVSAFRNISVSGKIAFDSQRTDYTVGGTPWWIASGDLNGDGKPELITANEGTNNITILPNTVSVPGIFSTSSFASPINYANANGSRSLTIGDLDGDSKPDLAVINKSQDAVAVMHNTSVSGTISFDIPQNFQTGYTPYGVSIGDVNGDGKSDLVTGNLQSVSVLRNTSAPGVINTSSFAAKIDVKTVSSPQVVAIGDLDKNSAVELVVANEYNNTLSIISTKITAKITFNPMPEKTYGVADFDPGATSNTAGQIIYKSNNPLVATIVNGKIHITGTGNADITASLPEGPTYAKAEDVTQHLIVKKAELTVSVDAVSKKYGQQNPKYTFAYSGFVYGENKDVLDVPPLLKAVTDIVSNTPVDILTQVGTYPIILANTPNDNNYTFTYTGNNLTIQKATLTAKADNISIPLNDPIPPFTITYSGWVGTDDQGYSFTSDPAVTSPAADNTVKGSYPMLVSGGSDVNYEFNYVNGILSVGKTNTSLSVGSFQQIQTYGNPDFIINASSDITDVPITFNSSNNAVATVTSSGSIKIVGAGSTKLRVSQEANGDYAAPADVYLDFTVTKAQLTATIQSNSKTYGHDNPPLLIQYSGFVYGENESVIDQPAIAIAVEDLIAYKAVDRLTSVNGGNPYPIIVLPENQAIDNNYEFVYVNGDLIINPATLTVIPQDATRTYGDNNPTFEISYEGFLNGETESTSGVFTTLPNTVTTATIISPVDAYPIVINGGISPNYTIVSTTATLTVEPATVLVSITDAGGGKIMSRNYGDSNPAFVIHYSGFKNSETESVLTTPATVPGSINNRTSAGIYPIAASGARALNYIFAYIDDAFLTINKIPLYAKAKDASRVYGSDNPIFELLYTSFVNDDTETDIDIKPTASAVDRFAGVSGSPYTITVTGGSDNNYTIVADNSGKLTITPAPLKIVADNQSRLYGEVNPALTYTYQYFVNGETEAGVFGSQIPQLSTTANSTSPVGSTHPIQFTYVPTAVNYTITTQNGTLSIGRATLTVAVNNKSRQYGTANPLFDVTYDGWTSGDDENSPDFTKPVLTTTAAQMSDVGTYNITFASDAISANYTIVQSIGQLTVTKAPLSLVADPATKSYGADNPSLTFTPSGLIAPDDINSALTQQPILATSATKFSPIGTYDIYFEEEAISNNYDLDHIGQHAFTITKANPVIDFTALATSLIYGDEDFDLSSTSDNTEVPITYTSSDEAVATVQNNVFHIVGAGTVTVKAVQAESSSFNSAEVAQTITINKATLTAKVTGASRNYGEDNPVFQIQYSGYVNNEDTQTNIITTYPIAATTAVKASPIGKYPIAVTGGVAANYNFLTVNDTLEVLKAPLIIVADSLARTYGEANPTLTFAYQGFKNGENETTPGVLTFLPVALTNAIITSPIGEYDITLSGAAADNYEIIYSPNILAVFPAILTVTADNKEKTYGDDNPALTLTYLGFKNNENENTPGVVTQAPIASTLVDKLSPVGTYLISLSSDGIAPNYTIVTHDGTLKVNKAELIVTAGNADKIYGEDNPLLTVSYSGFKNGENEHIAGVLNSLATPVTVATKISGAGDYDIDPAGASATNYFITPLKGKLTIHKATVTATADAKTRKYGEDNPLLTIKYSGFVNGDTQADIKKLPSVTTNAIKTSDVGDHYLITVNNDGDDENYVITGVANKLSITKALLIAKADNKIKSFGADNPPLTATYTGLANGELPDVIDLKPKMTTNAVKTSPIGDYDIHISNASDNNYEFNYIKGILSVGKKLPDLVVGDLPSGIVYGDADFQLSVSSNSSAPIFYDSNNTSVIQVDEDGVIHIVGAGETIIRISQQPDEDYGAAVDVYKTISVAKAPLTITAQNQLKNYGDDNPDLVLIYDGFVRSEDESVFETPAVAHTEATKISPIGTYAINVSGATTANYAITYLPGTLTINSGSPSISMAQLPAKTYGDADFKVWVTTNNTESSIVYTTSDPNIATVDVNGIVHIVSAGSVSITASQPASANFTQPASISRVLTVNRHPLKVIADNKSKKENEDNPSLTYSYEGFVNGDDATVVTAGSFSTSAIKTSPIGPYSIQVELLFTSPNYNISYQNGTLTINPANSVITFDPIEIKKYGDNDFTVTATTTSDGMIQYSVKNVSTVNPAVDIDPVSGLVHIRNAGQATITATVIGGTGYNTAMDISQQLTVLKVMPKITMPDFAIKNIGDPDFSTNATSTNSTVPLQHTSSDASVATVNSTTGLIHLAAGGYTNITVTQASSVNYETAVPVSNTLKVNKATIALILQPIAEKTYGDDPFIPVVAGATEAVTYSSSNSKVAIISNGKVYITGIGYATITATQPESGSYAAARDSKTLLVLPAKPTITFNNLESKTYGDADYLINAVSDVPGAVLTYGSSNVAVATISNGRIHITGVGTAKITVSQLARGNYSYAAFEKELVVRKAPLFITADDKTKVKGDVNPVLTVSYSGFVNNESYTVLDIQASATTSAKQNTSPGIYPIIASGAFDDNYILVYKSGILTILDIAKLTFNNLASKTYGDSDFKVVATSTNKNMPIIYTGDNPDIAIVDQNGNVHITGSGTVHITASQSGDKAFTPAESVSQSLIINKAVLTVTADDKISVVGVIPQLTVRYSGFQYNENLSVLTEGASASVNTDGLLGGTYIIRPSGASAKNYNMRYAEGLLTLTTDGLSFDFGPLPVKTYGDADFDPGARTNTGANIYYSSMNQDVVKIINNKIHITGAGSAEIVATIPGLDQTGNLILKQTLQVNKAKQTISFEPIPVLTRKGQEYVLAATSSSGLPVEFTSTNTFVGIVNGNLLSPFGTGSARIMASQVGNENYLPAENIWQEFEVRDNEGQEIRIPKALSPNGDGINDVFYIEGITEFPDNHLVIANRRGTKIYEAYNYNNGDVSFKGKGTFDGKARDYMEILPQGTYFYSFEFRNKEGRKERRTGYFVIKY